MTGAQIAGAQTAAPDDEAAAHAARAAEIQRAVPQWIAVASGHEGPSRNPSLPTLVGLFILILCFFVLLTSISLRDKDRESTVMASLARTFSGQGAAPPVAGAEAERQTRKMLGDLRAELNAEVPLVSGAAPATSDDYVLRLPRSLVFADGTKLAEGFSGILDRAFAALKTGPNDFAYEIEALVTAPRIDEQAIASAAAVESALRAAGFANDAAVVGLEPGDGATVTLTVRLRPNARLAPDDLRPAPAP
jgi:hypothetical protein